MRTDSNWIQTYTGRQYWPTYPRPDDVDAIDIGHHLANLCRYTGACREFYSVAQHCVLMSRIPWIVSDGLAFVALMHDAAEAYTGDFARPVKRELKAMQQIDMDNEYAVFSRFSLLQFSPLPAGIGVADRIMLATERRDLMEKPPRPWMSCENVEPLVSRIVPWSPAEAKERWLQRFREFWVGR